MTSRIWEFSIDGESHTVILEHGVLTGKRVLQVDGKELIRSQSILHFLADVGSRYPFGIGSHKCEARIRLRLLSLLGFRYELAIDNRLVSFLPVQPQPGGCLIIWMVLLVMLNSCTALSLLIPATLYDPVTIDFPLWMRLINIILSLAYVGTAISALRIGKWAFLGLYGLSMAIVPLNFINWMRILGVTWEGLMHTITNFQITHIIPWILVCLFTLLSWLLGILGIFILLSLMQDSGYMSD